MWNLGRRKLFFRRYFNRKYIKTFFFLFILFTESLRKPPKTAIHLWEFLLNLLLDEKCDHMICWTNREAGEFKLKNQEEVARRWGTLKHRPGMNYDKLSRALRYYYQKGIIKKVSKIMALYVRKTSVRQIQFWKEGCIMPLRAEVEK